MTVSIGDIVIYRPLPSHGQLSAYGSLAAIVGHYGDDGCHPLLVLVPNQAPIWVDAVEEGTREGQFVQRAVGTPTTPVAANDPVPEAPPPAPSPGAA